MSSITAQQTKHDLELVPKENRLDIGKFNRKIPHGLTPREPTFQVVMDAIALTPCYPVFLITIDVPEVYMHQFWNSVYKHDTFYRFKLDKKKRFKLTLKVFRNIFQIFPRVPGRDFDALPYEEDTMSFLRELGHAGEINSLNDVVIDQMHQPWRTFAALINRGLSGKTSGFDKLRLSKAQILWGMYYQKNVDYVELLWEDIIYQIENRVFKKQEKMYYTRFTKAIIHHFLIQDKTLSRRNKIGMHTSKDDYLINSLRFVSAKESTQIYGAILPECLTSPAIKESKSYKTYLDYATGVLPPKIARKFKKASPSKKDNDLVPVDEEPVTKGKRVKRSVKKSSTKPATGIVIREPHVETKSKRKEKVDVTRGKGIELLSKVALTEEAQMKEVRKKSLRDFHRLHPSGSGIVAEKPPRVDKITHPITSEGTGDKPGVPDVTKDESTESESGFWGNDEDDNNDENELENEGNDDENKSDDDKTPSNSEKDSDSEQDTDGNKKVDVEMTDAQQKKENLKITQEQVAEDAHVTITTVSKESEVPDASVSHSSDLASKFLNFSDIHHNDAEIIYPLDVHIHHEVPRIHTSNLFTVPVLVIPEASPVCTTIPQSSQTFTYPLLQKTPTPPLTIETTNIPSLILDFVSVFRFNDRVIALEQDVVELNKDPLHTQVSALVDDHLDTRMRASIEEFMNFLSASPTDRIIEQTVQSEEPEFKVGDTDTPQGHERNLEKIDWENHEGDDYPFDLSKPLPLITHGNHQSVPVEFFINNDLKEQRKSFYAYVRGKQSREDVYSTKCIMAVTHVSVMRKHGYGYLEEIVVRRVGNVLYKFKEGDDVADFAIALRMFTINLVIQKRASFLARRHYQEYQHRVAEEKMEQIKKEKSSFYDQGHQQAAKGKKDDEDFGEICWW
nr:hypothetical protein [Tanacetum cinerariifolium]